MRTSTLAILDLMDCTVTKAARLAVYVEVTSSACSGRESTSTWNDGYRLKRVARCCCRRCRRR